MVLVVESPTVRIASVHETATTGTDQMSLIANVLANSRSSELLSAAIMRSR